VAPVALNMPVSPTRQRGAEKLFKCLQAGYSGVFILFLEYATYKGCQTRLPKKVDDIGRQNTIVGRLTNFHCFV
jgi:hypothetical protein